MNRFAILLLVLTLGISCKNIEKESEISAKNTNNDYMILATNWFQKSAEMRAIYYQAYNTAKQALLLNKAQQKTDKKPAVVLDIDETILNNSPFQAKAIKTGIGYNAKTWKNWTDRASAEALPGALEFIKFAKKQGVEVFYISNRKVNELGTSMKNMQEKGFPNIDSSFFFLRSETSDKTKRRNSVRENYEIILFVGDNLTDFSEKFANRGEDFGFEIVDEHKEDFGTKFIILPNPMYGEWEKAIYKNSYDYNETEKDSLRRAALISY